MIGLIRKTGFTHRSAFGCLLAIFSAFAVLAGCRSNSESEPDGAVRVAFVTNGIAPFWTIAAAGVKRGGEEFDADAQTFMPAEGIKDQKQILEDLLTKRIDGVAVSAIDPVNQVDLLNEVAERAVLISSDSDAPGSNRVCYIGMDNYQAGRLCGELVREAIPDGGKVAIFIGRLEQDNARRRHQGTIDAILGRDPNPDRHDPPGQVLQADGYQIVGTYTDQFDRFKGKANVEDVLSRYPDIAALVGLFQYNPTLILEAVSQADRLGDVQIIAFDEADETLAGIADGSVYGTVVQDPFEYGRQSVRVMAGLVRGKTAEQLGIPADGFLDIPTQVIRADNVEAFTAELKRKLGE